MEVTLWTGSKRSTICNYHFQFTETAVADLDEILSYIANELNNPQAAAVFFSNLEDKIKETCHYPYSGPELRNDFIVTETVRMKVVDSYLFYYVIRECLETVIILRIVYGPRNQKEIQQKLSL